MKKAEHVAKNLALNAFLALRAPAGSPPLPPPLDANSTVVFLRLNRIGDALVSTPLIQFVKQRFKCRTVVVASRHNHFIFEGHASVDHVVVYHKGPLGLPRARRQAQAFHPTLVIDLHEQLSTTVSLLAGLLRAPYKFAIRKPNARLFTHTVTDLDPARHHVLERLANIGTLLGPIFEGPPLAVAYRVSAAATDRARAFLAGAFPGGAPPAGRLVGVNTSAGGEARFWGGANFRRLAQALRARGLTPLVLTAPADEARVRAALAVNTAPETDTETLVFCAASFEDFAAVISLVAVLFTPDTAAVHVAAAYHLPVFGLYVAERPGQLNWYPYGSRYDWLIAPHAVAELPFELVWARFAAFLDSLPPAS